MAREKQELMRPESRRAPAVFEEMERWFEESLRNPFSIFRTPWWMGSRFPGIEDVTVAMDVFQDGDDMVVRAELPGLKKEEINVNVSDGVLTISGEKKREEKIDRRGYHRLESSSGSFSRSVRLPGEVESEKAKASFRDGVLEIRLPTSEEARKKRKQIEVE